MKMKQFKYYLKHKKNLKTRTKATKRHQTATKKITKHY